MAEPKLQIEQRLDRIEIAIIQMLHVGYGAKDAEEIEKILRVKDFSPEPEVTEQDPQKSPGEIHDITAIANHTEPSVTEQSPPERPNNADPEG